MKRQDYLKEKINALTKQNELLLKESQHYKQKLDKLRSKLDKKLLRLLNLNL
ncbi:hypothetical protein O5404_04540 (plasmid) [Borrelia miyamotoi]|uniref:Uncharacterized protein n=1 Tax=Borrelia miyamotoi TaxID=47466 RepID=A0AAX3JNT8_9SPIR|nr:hypothetical protein [Borrelia miyamotoi]WAZ72295.1 hypothetical protein O5404_04540 [Borrelia miyamotoi]